LTVPIDISDPTLVRAYAHPLRRQILGLLDNRTASPSEIAAELGTPLSNTSYHVRQLVSLGLVELVSRTARRGAIEHHYTARVRPTTTDEAWEQLPSIVKRSVIEGWLQQLIHHLLAAAVDGGFDRNGAHHTRTPAPLDEKGWETISRELERTLRRIDKAVEESRERIAEDPDSHVVDASIVMMQFEAPASKKPRPRRSKRPARRDLPELQLDEA
jgi:DNA-binding transcriptional ArsR family regulator